MLIRGKENIKKVELSIEPFFGSIESFYLKLAHELGWAKEDFEEGTFAFQPENCDISSDLAERIEDWYQQETSLTGMTFNMLWFNIGPHEDEDLPEKTVVVTDGFINHKEV